MQVRSINLCICGLTLRSDMVSRLKASDNSADCVRDDVGED